MVSENCLWPLNSRSPPFYACLIGILGSEGGALEEHGPKGGGPAGDAPHGDRVLRYPPLARVPSTFYQGTLGLQNYAATFSIYIKFQVRIPLPIIWNMHTFNPKF